MIALTVQTAISRKDIKMPVMVKIPSGGHPPSIHRHFFSKSWWIFLRNRPLKDGILPKTEQNKVYMDKGHPAPFTEFFPGRFPY